MGIQSVFQFVFHTFFFYLIRPQIFRTPIAVIFVLILKIRDDFLFVIMGDIRNLTFSILKEESSSPISTANVSGSAGSTAENSTAVVDVHSHPLHLLSQSVPTNWGGGGGGGSQQQHSQLQHQQQQHHQYQQQQRQQQTTGFNTSVDQVRGRWIYDLDVRISVSVKFQTSFRLSVLLTQLSCFQTRTCRHLSSVQFRAFRDKFYYTVTPPNTVHLIREIEIRVNFN